MVSINKMETNALKVFVLVLLLQFSSSVCEDNEENDREKRTIGVLFRTFVDAFQTQRQPAPMVHSYQPPRQIRPQAQAQQSQSTKADLLSSSKTIFQQKKNLLKPATTQAPDTELITPSVSLPPVATQAPNPALQVASPYEANQLQALPPSPPSTLPMGPLQNTIPHPGHPSLKAQILLIPFDGTHGSGIPFPGLELEPRLPYAAPGPPFNYQAEIYLQGPHNGVFPLPNQYPGRHSPSNGWHDASEVLSRGIQSNYESEGREDAGVINLSKPNRPELTTYNPNDESPAAATPSQYPNEGASSSQTQQESESESRRRENTVQNYYDGQRYNLEQPLFIPNFQHDGLVSSEDFGYQQEGNFLMTTYPNYPEKNPFITPTPENAQNNNKNEENVRSTNPAQKQVKVVNSIPPHKSINNAHDYLPQRGGYQKYPESGNKNKKYEEPSLGGSYGEKNQYPEEQYYQYQENGYDIQQQQYPTRVGKLPDLSAEHQHQLAEHQHQSAEYQHQIAEHQHHPPEHQHQSAEYQHHPAEHQHHPAEHQHHPAEHQHLLAAPWSGSFLHLLESPGVQGEPATHYSGQNYYKRSNQDENNTTKNCFNCNENK